MTAIFTALLPLLGAAAAGFGVAALWNRITRMLSWQRMLKLLVVPVVFVATFLALSALAVAIVGGDVIRTLVVDGSRGPAVWRVTSIVFFEGDDDTIERRRLDIIDVDSGRRIKRHDYVHWFAVPIDVELLGEGRDFLWLYSRDIGLHTRDAYDGHWLHGQRELIGDTPLMGHYPFEYDATTRGLLVSTKAGKRLLDPRTLQLVDPSAAVQAPNRFAGIVDDELTLPSGRHYTLEDGSLRRRADSMLGWHTLGTTRFPGGFFMSSAFVQAELPDTFFIAHQGNLSRVEADGTVRWTQTAVVDSKHMDADAVFTRNGRLCILQDDRLACFSLDNGKPQWVIR
jgi:hypothetical protein